MFQMLAWSCRVLRVLFLMLLFLLSIWCLGHINPCQAEAFSLFTPQVTQARYMSSSMWTFALLRDSSDLHVYKDLYGERNKPEKKRKITVELQ